MPDAERNGRLEIFKAFSTFISSVVVAAAGLLVTNCYNGQQLQISRNKELSSILPKLGSAVPAERRAAALSLSLYGEEVIPPLIAVMDDSSAGVREAAITALVAIGKPAKPGVKEAFSRAALRSYARESALSAWGRMGDDSVYHAARSVLLDSRERSEIRSVAVEIMTRFQTDATSNDLVAGLRLARNEDYALAENIAYYLTFVHNPSVPADLVDLLTHHDDRVREQVIWALAIISADKYRETLPTFRCDTAVRVRDAIAGTALRLNIPPREYRCDVPRQPPSPVRTQPRNRANTRT